MLSAHPLLRRGVDRGGTTDHRGRSDEMAHFVGLDVSVRGTSVCVVDDAGKVVLGRKYRPRRPQTQTTSAPATTTTSTSACRNHWLVTGIPGCVRPGSMPVRPQALVGNRMPEQPQQKTTNAIALCQHSSSPSPHRCSGHRAQAVPSISRFCARPVDATAASHEPSGQ
jgi:hypothetical protein